MRLVPLPGKAQKILEELQERNGKVIELSKGAARNGFDKARKRATCVNYIEEAYEGLA